MKPRKWQAIVMVAFAWVLWEMTEELIITKTQERSKIEWKPLDGYDKFTLCKSAQKMLIGKLRKDKFSTNKYQANQLVKVLLSSPAKNILLIKQIACFPGNLDPTKANYRKSVPR